MGWTTAPYLPTPPEIVRRMLKIARVGPGDVVYDLGCGDGRILIMAARARVMDTWLKDMEQGKPQVVATIIGRSVLTRVLRLVKELGYEVANISESESWLFKKYNVTFKRAR